MGCFWVLPNGRQPAGTPCWDTLLSPSDRRTCLVLLRSLQYEVVKDERRQAELHAAAQQAGKTPLSPLFTVRRRRFHGRLSSV